MEMISYLSDLQDRVAIQNKECGWYDSSRTIDQLMCLIIEEIGEATTGLRREVHDDHLPKYPMYVVELADVVIRTLDAMERLGYNWPKDMKTMFIPKIATTPEENNMHLASMCTEVWLFGRNGQVSDNVPHQLKRLAMHAFLTIGSRGYDAINVIEDKMYYNRSRADHKPENRAKAGGKKW